MLISHDRNLLDSLCDKIIEVKDGQIKFFYGNYSSYKEQNEREIKYQEFEYEKFIKEKGRLEKTIIERQRKSKK